MTDKEKLDAIRAEIHRLVDVRGYDREMANDLFAFMDSLPNEPVSEGLEQASRNYADNEEYGDDVYFAIKAAFKVGAKWQKERDEDEIRIIRELLDNFDKTCDEYHDAGFKHGQEALMKDATETTVHIGAGNYPYIPQMELYDYDKDIPLAKEGDKYKVILIKEG